MSILIWILIILAYFIIGFFIHRLLMQQGPQMQGRRE
jgi:uncharacterized protein YneF (UPF0154 family)